jgi:hypothetical protein
MADPDHAPSTWNVEQEPLHERGVVPTQPGLYFVGLLFLDSLASEMIHGVGRDAARIARHIAARVDGSHGARVGEVA